MYRINYNKNTRTKSKYHNVTQEYGGKRYDSKKEAAQAQELDWRLKAGEITGWERQVKIELRAYGKHITNYFIDFVATRKDGTKEYIEVKGFETEVWKMKWKIFEAMMNDQEPDSELIVIK